MSLLLACDTTQQACSVALMDAENCLYEKTEEMARGQAERLMPMIAEAMRAAKITPAHLSSLAVTIGPGTFTGVRLGLSAMRGMALALDLPLMGVNTLHAMAKAVTGTNPNMQDILVVVDARRDAFYVQKFTPDGDGITPPQNLSMAEILPLLSPYMILVGTGKEVVKAAARAHMNTVLEVASVPDYPQARYVADCALLQPISDIMPTPLYLRPADATLPRADHTIQRHTDI